MGFRFVVLDFETRSSSDLTKGVTPYVQNFEPICMAVKFGNSKTDIVFFDNIKPLCKTILNFSKRNYVVAHNVAFDFSVFQKITGCEDKAILRWIDTSTLSNFLGGPSGLYPCGLFWELGIKKSYGIDLIDTLSKPYKDYGTKRTPVVCEGVKTEDHVKNGFVEHEKLFQAMGKYCIQDVEVTYELFKKLYPYYEEFKSQKSHLNFVLNFLRNKRGLHFDMDKVEKYKDIYDALCDKYVKLLRKVTKNDTFKMHSPIQIKKFLKKHGHSIEKTRLNDLEVLKSKEPAVKNFLKLIKTRPTSAGKKFHTISKNNFNGVIFDSLRFYGAITGRYIASGTLQSLNMPRRFGKIGDLTKEEFLKKHKFDSFKILRGQIRECLIPHEGCEFVGGDFSAIELKLILACCGEKKKLEKIEGGWDAYKFLASKVFKKPMDNVTTNERYIAKRATLAFGYGLGVNTLINTLAGDFIHIDEKEAESLKNIYFSTFTNVYNFWNRIFSPFRSVKQGGTVKVEVPFSKKPLYFWGVEKSVDKGRYVYRCKSSYGGFKNIYSSMLCGLVVQSLAVGVFHNAERELYKKFKILVDLPVHDEFVCSVKKGAIDLDEFKQCIETPPKWLPFEKLSAEVWKGDYYSK